MSKIMAAWDPWINNWRKSWCADISKLPNRIAAYFDMIVLDHGYTRYLYPNKAWIGDQVIRQNHPPPKRVKWAAAQGIKTIVNLRGPNNLGSNILSAEYCDKYNIDLVYLRALSRATPSKDVIHKAEKMFDEIEYPAMFHCKSGADRAGIISALYVLIKLKRPVAEAQAQLSWKFGHFKQAKTGVLDFFLDQYRLAQEKTGIEFMDWVNTEYDPKAITKAFKVKSPSNFIVDYILRRE